MGNLTMSVFYGDLPYKVELRPDGRPVTLEYVQQLVREYFPEDDRVEQMKKSVAPSFNPDHLHYNVYHFTDFSVQVSEIVKAACSGH